MAVWEETTLDHEIENPGEVGRCRQALAAMHGA
jgi:hypothetical protein